MKSSYRNGYKVNLIETLEDFEYAKSYIKHVMSIDTETSGLNFLTDTTAGYCIGGGSPLQGFYYPVRHYIGKNLPLEPMVEYINDCYSLDKDKAKKIMLFNKSFDHTMMEKDGVVIPLTADHNDVQCMVWEATNEKFPSLKENCKNYLKMEMIEFSEVAGDVGYNFKETDPEQSYPYAAFDPVATILLGRRMWNDFPYIRRIYPLDNFVTEVARLMGKIDIKIDHEVLKRDLLREEKVLREYYSKCIALAGYEFNPSSNRQKGEALSRFVTLTVKTKKGDFAVGDKVLSEVDHPLAEALLLYSKQVKYISSFLRAILKYEGKEFHSNMSLVNVPTGRMSTGKMKGNPYYAEVNIMGIKKLKMKRYLHFDDSLPHGYYLDDNPEGAIGKQTVKAGTRDAFIAPEGYYFFTSDYDSEELNIVANLAGERLHTDAIYLGKDAHMLTARKVFGVESEDFRDKIKTCNFLKNYGGEPPTLAKRLKISLAEAKKMFTDYDRALQYITRWKEYVVKEARSKGMVFTYYGRPRLLWKYYQSSEKGMKAFADRSAINSICQGGHVESTRVLTENGFVEIKSLLGVIKQDSTEVYPYAKVWNGEKFCEFGILEHKDSNLKRIRLRNGYTDVNDQYHVYKVIDDNGIHDVPRDSIVVGDKILCSFPSKVESPKAEWSDFEFYVAGRFLGDGNLTSGILTISCSISELKETYDMFSKYFTCGSVKYSILDNGRGIEDLESRFTVPGRVSLSKKRRGDSAQFSILKKESSFLFEMGFDERCVARNKRIPYEIFNSSLSQRAQFIRGFYDSDGGKHDVQFRWHICQRPILEDLQLLLRSCGIRSILYDLSDGTFTLVVVNSEDFAEFIGIEDKSRSFKKYGRYQDLTKTPRFMELKFLEWWDSVKTNGYYKLKGISDEQWSRDRSIISKIRNNKGCGISTFYELCDSLGYDYGMKILPVEVESITDEGEGQTYCLCLWDESHQYEANGMIHHNCVPSNTHFESKRSAIKFESVYGQFSVTADNREAVASHRGEGDIVFLWSFSGDFKVCDTQHGFLSKSKQTGGYKVHTACDGFSESVLTSKLQRKVIPNPISLFKCSEQHTRSVIKRLPTMNKVTFSKDLNVVFWHAYLKKYKFSMDFYTADSLRTIASIFGFNLLYDWDTNQFFLSAHREKRVLFTRFKFIGKSPIASLTMRDGYQMYPAGGFLNKNTGADIMRNLMCKIYLAYENDPELKDNFIFAFHVHDEINGYIKKEYVHKAFKFIQETQTVVNENWLVPLRATTGIGSNWGNGVDVEYVGENGSFVPLEGTFYNREDYLKARERAGMPVDGPKWRPNCVEDFYKRHPYTVTHVD